jgi:hypothetical protein
VEIFNERRAQRAITALRTLAEPTALVRRGGRSAEVAAEAIVPGDVILLQAGRRIPADARLVEAYGLAVDKSPLTGESIPIEKATDLVLPETIPLSERRNLVFAATTVTRGRGAAVVVATSIATELGRVASLAREITPPPTPLQQAMRELSRSLVWLALGFSVIVPVLRLVIGLIWLVRHEAELKLWWAGILAHPRVVALCQRLAPQLAFLQARLTPGGYLGLHLTVGVLILVTAVWLFGAVVEDVVTADPLVLADQRVSAWLHAHATPTLIAVMRGISALASVPLVSLLTVLSALALVIRRRWYWLLDLGLVVPGGLLLNALLKDVFDRARPSFEHTLVHLTTYSFPSGHTVGATLFYGLLRGVRPPSHLELAGACHHGLSHRSADRAGRLQSSLPGRPLSERCAGGDRRRDRLAGAVPYRSGNAAARPRACGCQLTEGHSPYPLASTSRRDDFLLFPNLYKRHRFPAEIISYAEHMCGWMAYLARPRSIARQMKAYGRLHRQLHNYCRIPVFTFDEPAAVTIQRLRRARSRMGTIDLKIAAIALSRDATLLSRNLADFRQVPGLQVEDWIS